MTLKFYLDENVSERITDALRAKGYDATSANRLGKKALGDGLQLLTAADLGRVLVTYDVVHFSLLHEAWHAWSQAWNAASMARHGGILLIYGRKGDIAPEIAEAIHRFAGSVGDTNNRLFAWNRDEEWHEVR